MKNYIFAALFTGVYDVNRNEILEVDNFDIIKDWYNSINLQKLNAVVFHNTFSKETIAKYQNEFVKFEFIQLNTKLNPNIFRYTAYYDYIIKYKSSISNIFITDITDVVVLQNPFKASLFTQNNASLFCGDEPKLLSNNWMHNHNTHLRNTIPNFIAYEKDNANKTLLNCGIIGGSLETIIQLLAEIVHIHNTYSISNKTPYTLDMGVFNYVVRTSFVDKIFHGAPVNTLFKEYQLGLNDCWFRHK